MRLFFDYRCRKCGVGFEDPAKPIMEAANFLEAEQILKDSLLRNPTAKKRVNNTQTHLCATNQIGVGDVMGYRFEEAPQEVQAPIERPVLKLVESPVNLN